MGLRGIRVKTAVTLLVLGGVLLAAMPLHAVWWRTARQSSLQLVSTLSEQITGTVRREFWERVVAAEAAYHVAWSLLGPEPDRAAADQALRAALTATPVPSAATYVSPRTGGVIAARDASGAVVVRESGSLDKAARRPPEGWREAPPGPANDRAAVAYSGPASAAGTLSVYIGMDRFSSLLGQIPVGKTGAAVVIDAQGALKVMPTQNLAEALNPVIGAAAAVVAARPANAVNIVETRRLLVDGAAYQTSFSPLEFNGWQFVVVVPEAEFLSDIDATTRKVLIGLLGLVAALGLAAALLAQWILTRPVAALTADLRKVERFELEDVRYRAERLREFDQLSAAIARMATGLADFAKFIPTDLVRTLLAEGVRATPGGETRQLTVMFADVAGFTKLSERMGIAVIDVISRYLDVVSRTVERNRGTVDKFIGDAVMAFWGAPRLDGEQARNACLAALSAIEAVKAAGITDDKGAPLSIRIGIHSGAAVVGNIGSTRRLNYTAIGDTVNLASRLEGVNKVFGTSILISDSTRMALGDAFVLRELAEVSVAGKVAPVVVHELLGLGGEDTKPTWALDYEAALKTYRGRDFAKAIRILEGVLKTRPEDGPSLWLKELCDSLRGARLPADWRGIVRLEAK
jgi:adenylate cyclase